jgi:choline kinase
MKPSLVILAAGLSTRYGGLKQLDGIGPNGEALLDYGVYDAVRSGFSKIVFVIRPELEQLFREHIRDRLAGAIVCALVHQRMEDVPKGFSIPADRKKPWGAGHALLMAEQVVDGTFAACNADDFYGASAYTMLHDHLHQVVADRQPAFAMVGYRLRDTLSSEGGVSRGLCRIDGEGYLEMVTEVRDIAERDGRITGLAEGGELRTLDGTEIVSMSLWGFLPTVFPLLRRRFVEFLRESERQPEAEFVAGNVLNDEIAVGRTRVRVLLAEDPWFGITFPLDRKHAVKRISELVSQGRYPGDLSAWFAARS